MDMNKREQFVEKTNHLHKSLKESFAIMQSNKTKLLKENAFAIGKQLTNKQVVREEEKPLDAPTAPVEGGDVPPAPVDINAPEGTNGEEGSQEQFATKEFVKNFMKGLPTEVDLEGSVDSNGVFKVEVDENGAVAGGAAPIEGGEVPPVEGSDVPPTEEPPVEGGEELKEAEEAGNTFTVLVFPASKSIREVADLLEPVSNEPEATGTELPPVDGAAPVEGGELPPVEGGEEDKLKESLTEGRKPKAKVEPKKKKGSFDGTKYVLSPELDELVKRKKTALVVYEKQLAETSDATEKADIEEMINLVKSQLARIYGSVSAELGSQGEVGEVPAEDSEVETTPEQPEKPELAPAEEPLDAGEESEDDLDAAENLEAEKEKERDPMMEGRKNWKSMLNTLLTEGKK